MKMKQLCSTFCLLLLYVLFFLPVSSFAGPFVSAGGSASTPSVYEVTINKIEFKKSDGSYYTYLSTPATIDIGAASVQPGGTGGFASGQAPPPGTYTAMRVTIARTFGMTGSATNVGPAPATTCRTTTGAGTGPLTAGLVTYTVSNATNTSGQATKQSVLIPTSSDSSIENGMNNAGLLLINANEVQFEVPVSLTISETDTYLPFEIDFDVSNRMEFLNTGSCYVIPLPPTVTVTTSSGTQTFDSGI